MKPRLVAALAIASSAAGGWAFQPNGVTTAAGQTSPEAPAIQAALETYVKALETKDLVLFKSVKPNTSPEEERRIKAAFGGVRSHTVEMTIQSISLVGNEATVTASRRDTLNKAIVSSFTQVFVLQKHEKAWNIVEMRR
jgi:hypothetical protein